MLAFDYGTVRLFDTGSSLEVHFSKDDQVAKDAIRKYKARYDPNRRCWKVEYSGLAHRNEIAASVKNDILDSVPARWKSSLPRLEQVECVTRRFHIVLGAGGARIRLPSGNKHEYTLRDKVPKAEKIGMNEWTIPASACGDSSVKEVITDVIVGDKVFYGKCVDYMEGFSMSGRLKNLDAAAMALIAEDSVIFALPEFVHAVDEKLQKEPVKVYALQVYEREDDGDGLKVDLVFLTGKEGYNAAEAFRRVTNPIVLDTNMIDGKWRRRRS